MATISAAVSRISNNSVVITWTGATNGDTFEPVPSEFADYSDRSIQASGTFGGATINLQGSNDGTNYANLSDPQGVVIGLTAAGIKQVLEAVRYQRPAISGGTGSSINVTMFLRRGRGGKEV
jgi:hypothetical protein